MTRPRRELIALDDTPYCHSVSRCVRRAFLCGREGELNFEHRRGWIGLRMKELAANFAIDIATDIAVSNYCHLAFSLENARLKFLPIVNRLVL